MRVYITPIWVIVSLCLWGYVLWSWTTWLKLGEKEAPGWRAIIVVAGLCLATISTALNAFLYVHAVFTGGYPLFHPIELMCIRLGSLTAMLGIICALAGKGRLRLSVTIISIFNLLVWYSDAMAL